jgi:hypothetical protein
VSISFTLHYRRKTGTVWTRTACSNGFGNLFCIGRYGIHEYNHQDQSMLAATRVAMAAIISGNANSDTNKLMMMAHQQRRA